MFESQKKKPTRNSILKQSGRDTISTNKKQESTALGLSVKFKQQKDLQPQFTKQFKEISTEKKNIQLQHQIPKIDNLSMESYDKWNLIKDINYLNNIENHILMMLSSHFKQNKPNNKISAKQQNLIGLIKKEIYENLQLKEQLDKKVHKVNEIYEISQYLQIDAKKFMQTQCDTFLMKFQKRQRQAKQLEERFSQLQSKSRKMQNFGSDQIFKRQQRCKSYSKKLQKEIIKINMLQQQEKKLLKKLYKTQKDILRNEKSNSTLKLKINQIEAQDQYRKIRSKTKIENHRKNKQNTISLQNKGKENSINIKKNTKIQVIETLKGNFSLNKLIKKRIL